MADEENVAEKPAAQGGGSNKLLLIVVVVLLVLVVAVGVGVVFALMGSKGDAGGAGHATEAAAHGDETEVEEAEHGEEGAGAVFPLETFIVNLKIKGSFLKTDIQLVFANAAALEGGGGGHGGGGGLDSQIPKIRDVVILILSSKEAQEVLSIEGKEQLREEIRSGVNEVLGHEDVTQVLFTEFIVQ